MFSKLVVLALALGVSVAAADVRSDFESFKKLYSRTYSSQEEEDERFQIFARNMETAARLTAEEKTATYGATKYADMTEAEFKQVFLGYNGNWKKFSNETLPKYEKECTACARFPELAQYENSVPTELDWTTKGAVTDVKNQGYCGSCWSFGTTGDVEGTWFLAGNDLVALSEQQLVSCDYLLVKDGVNLGCNGGLQESAFNYIINEAPYGLVSEDAYPYVSGTGERPECDTSVVSRDNVAAKISSWSQVSSSAQEEDDIYTAVVNSGPVTIGINADKMQFYTGGVANPAACPASGVDHAVLIVGFGEDSGEKYWKIKNSWGEDWGEDGYYRIVAGSNACGLATDVVHSAV